VRALAISGSGDFIEPREDLGGVARVVPVVEQRIQI